MHTGAVPCLLIIIAVFIAGCPRVISLDYIPSNKLRGQGRLQVETFQYRMPEKGIEKPKEMGADAQEFEVFYLSQDIGTFFTNAVKSELSHSGYEVVPAGKVVVSGTVERFYFDYERPDGQAFEIHVSYRVSHGGDSVYSYICESVQQRSTTLTTSGLVIKAGIKDCIERFIQAAQDAKAL
jgi:hypothetical protein